MSDRLDRLREPKARVSQPRLGLAARSVIQGPECVAPSQKSFKKKDQARAGGPTEGTGLLPMYTARLASCSSDFKGEMS